MSRKSNNEQKESLLGVNEEKLNHENGNMSMGDYSLMNIKEPTKMVSVQEIPGKRSTRDLSSSLQSSGETKNVGGNATMTASVINLTKTILGGGVLGLPYALSKSGYALGIVLFVTFALLSSIGLHLLMSSARMVPNSTFNSLSKLTVPKAKKLVDFAVILKSFGAATSYLVIVGDLMPDVMHEWIPSDNSSANDTFGNRRFWISVFTITFVIPFVRFREMERLKSISAAALLCFVYVLIVVVVYASVSSLNPCKNNAEHCKGSVDPFPIKSFDFFKVLPIYIFGFTCHHNACSITNELSNNTMQRLNTINVCSISIAMISYACIAYCAYFTFGSEVESDILSNYTKSWAVLMVRIVLAISLAWSFPLQCHPARQCIASLLFEKSIEELNNKIFYVITYAFTLSAFALSMAVDNLSVVLAFVGSTGSVALSYVVPGIFFYFLHKDQPNFPMKHVALAMIILGCLITPFAVVIECL